VESPPLDRRLEPAAKCTLYRFLDSKLKKALLMNSFDERKRGEEAKFVMDEQTEFKVMARRNTLLGKWAADLMGLSGADVDAYAKQVRLSDLEEAGDDDVFRKIRGDFDAKNVDRSDEQIREQMAQLLAVAREQIEKGE